MTAFSEDTFCSRNTNATAQIEALQQAILDDHRKLEEIRQQRRSAEEYITRRSKKHELDLIRENGEVVELLRDLDHLLQEESHLSDLLNGEASRSSDNREHLQKMTECMANKARSLTVEILEVKQCLTEAKARYVAAAQDMTRAPTSKSKRKQRYPSDIQTL